MNGANDRVRGLGVAGALFICCSTAAVAAGPRTLAGVACESPPPQHCAGACVPALLGDLGNATEPKSLGPKNLPRLPLRSQRQRRPDIVDSAQGYVTGASPGRPPSWGRDARPGTAQEFVYPGCNGKKVVADVLRLDKGHTEGLEPKVTEELVRLMVAAPGGKLQKSP